MDYTYQDIGFKNQDMFASRTSVNNEESSREPKVSQMNLTDGGISKVFKNQFTGQDNVKNIEIQGKTQRFGLSHESVYKRQDSKFAQLQDQALQGQAGQSQAMMMSQTHNQFQKSHAGFEVGDTLARGSFFTSVRQRIEDKDDSNFYDTEKLNGNQFVEDLIKSQQEQYQKKFAFEKGVYHQCIPNPLKENQMITVQLVKKVLENFSHEKESNQKDEDILFPEQQHIKKDQLKNISRTVQRYVLTKPDDEEINEGDFGEDDFETKKNGDELDKGGSSESNMENLQENLYENLEEHEDQLTGISPFHYANIKEDPIWLDEKQSQNDSQDFAVIAFWDIDKWEDVFKCQRFFIVPNPMKRSFIDSGGAQLSQVLYSSDRTKDIFLFYRDYEDETTNPQNHHKLKVAFLKLEQPEADKIEGRLCRKIEQNCEEPILTIEDDSVLETFIDYLDKTPFNEQQQLPNPTVIKTINGDETDQIGKTIVFTAYLKQLQWSQDYQEGMENAVEDNWYPSIFFHCLNKNRVVWEIFGAEVFIDVDKNENIIILTNQIWQKLSQSAYQNLNNEVGDFQKHFDYSFYFLWIKYQSQPNRDQIEVKDEQAPTVPPLNSFKLVFGDSKSLDITGSVKVVQAYLHDKNERATLVYKGLGSFTFQRKSAKTLAEPNYWHGSYKQKKFRVLLTLSNQGKSIRGSGQDQKEENVNVDISIERKSESNWHGYYNMGGAGLKKSAIIADLSISNNVISATWIEGHDDQQMKLKGQLKEELKDHSRNFSLNLSTENDIERIFKGTIDQNHSVISGKWHLKSRPEKSFNFKFTLADELKGKMSLTFKKELRQQKDIIVDFTNRKIKLEDGEDDDLKEFYAEEADHDTAELIYFISQSDVTFFKHAKMNKKGVYTHKAYIQAKLKATEDEEESSNGQGYAPSNIVLYNVSSKLKDKKDKIKKINKKSIAREPNSRKYYKFALKETYLTTQKNRETLLLHVNQSVINSEGRLIGSVIYEELGSSVMVLNFFTAQLDQDDKLAQLDYPQIPMPQSWIVDYPLLAYKTYSPDNSEIAIVHMAQNMPQSIINLGEWEFVCFVNHTQMVEQRLFGMNKETNCDIMFLVRRDRKIRLMSFKNNPWLPWDPLQKSKRVDNSIKNDPEIYKEAIFLFNGFMLYYPDQFQSGIRQEAPQDMKKFCRRFNNDKVQTVQLITTTKGSYEEYMIIMQFDDCIVRNSLNSNKFVIICEPEAMLRNHLVRGYNEKIFYAETKGNSEIVNQIEFHATEKNEISQKEIFQLTGRWIVAIETDGESIQNDTVDIVTQSLYIMDDHSQIYIIKNKDDIRFEVTKTIDFSPHKSLTEATILHENDWSHVHITERTLSINSTTYNLNSLLKVKISVPKTYFGDETTTTTNQDHMMADLDKEQDDSNSDSSEDEQEQEDNWLIQSVQSMSMTTNVIAMCQNAHSEFCFVMKPAPGSRKINIVGFQQLQELEQMLFVSNYHVLVKFRGGKAVTLLANGSIVHQQRRVQNFLEQNSKVVGESQIHRGKKAVLLRQKYDSVANQQSGQSGQQDQKLYRTIALQFNSQGIATVVAIFNDFKDQVLIQLKAIAQEYQNELRTLRQNEEKKLKQKQEQEQETSKYTRKQSIRKPVQYKQESQEEEHISIKFAKEFFINPKAEVIKMAAIVTPDPSIREALNQEVQQTMSSFSPEGKQKAYISVLSVQNSQNSSTNKSRREFTMSQSQFNQSQKESNTVKGELKVIVFHCLTKELQNQFAENTQFSVVGDYLSYRNRKEKIIKVIRIKDYISQKDPDIISQSLIDADIHPKQPRVEKYYQDLPVETINLKGMVDGKDLEHIQMTEVPKAYFTTIKSRIGRKLDFYSNLLQVTGRLNGMIYDLDDVINQLYQIQNIDQIQNPNQVVNTGFIMSISTDKNIEDQDILRRIQIVTNENVNLLFEKRQDRFKTKSGKLKTQHSISGMLYRTFSEIDLRQLHIIQVRKEQRSKMSSKIDLETILSTYEGHTIFSIFWDSMSIYEQIMKQLKKTDFKTHQNIDHQECENQNLRRLYRILQLPTSGLRGRKQKQQVNSDVQKHYENSGLSQCINWLRQKIGIVVKSSEDGREGFKSIVKKSIHQKNARFMETLIEIAMLCEENSISDFVDNQEDMRILLYSMTPPVTKFLNKPFTQTRFTKKVKNLDWEVNRNLKVFGKSTFQISQKQADKEWTIGKAKDSDHISNREVEINMLDIGWIYANQGIKQKIDFRDFLIILSRAPHESVYDTQLIKVLFKRFSNRFRNEIVKFCFIPFLIYAVFSLFFITIFTTHSMHGNDELQDYAALVIGTLIIIISCYFMYFEFYQLLRDGFQDYFTELYNYQYNCLFVMNAYLVYKTIFNGESRQTFDERQHLLLIATLTIILIWLQIFYWARLFRRLSIYVRLIRTTLYDMIYFFIFFLLILLMFGNAMIIINESRYENESVYDEVFGYKLIDAVTNQYILALGEYYQDDYLTKGEDNLVWILFIVSTFITQITFLNMLIAVMGDSFAKIKEVEKRVAMKETIGIMSDYGIAVRRVKSEAFQHSRFIFAIKPTNIDEGEEWEGATTQIKRFVLKNSDQLKRIFTRRMGKITDQVSEVSKRLSNLDGKLNGVNQQLVKMSNISKQEQEGSLCIRKQDVDTNSSVYKQINELKVEMRDGFARMQQAIVSQQRSPSPIILASSKLATKGRNSTQPQFNQAKAVQFMDDNKSNEDFNRSMSILGGNYNHDKQKDQNIQRFNQKKKVKKERKKDHYEK